MSNAVLSTRAIDAERIKLTTTRSPYWCVGIVAVLGIGVAVLFGLATHAGEGGGSDDLSVSAFSIGVTQLGVVVLMIMGVLSVTSEIRFGTLRTSFLAVPRRTSVLLSKAVVYGGLSLVVAFVVNLVGIVLGTVLSGESGDRFDLAGSDAIRAYWGVPVYVFFCVLVSIGVGALIRQSAGAIVVVLIWMLALETVLANIPKVGPAVGPFLPFLNGQRIFESGSVGSVDFHWNAAGSGVYFAVVSVIVFVAGVVVTNRRDA
ncbi:ABC transporter permease [Williamsia sterculiae]|uniref:ABC-2 type transport system permease protein n=1 Tax=Williamsia sterculiae TaxID=1344003 RepID=A0A1N7F134_9NOCA|nr:ABC transporter permease [Williamsia sterculiae]SIR94050.1 ABC-2 type transport system permease protein [Williamsia sterculiae]